MFNHPTTFQFILNLFPNNSIPVNDRATLLIGVLKTGDSRLYNMLKEKEPNILTIPNIDDPNNRYRDLILEAACKCDYSVIEDVFRRFL